MDGDLIEEELKLFESVLKRDELVELWKYKK
jgi:hypothetical protein